MPRLTKKLAAEYEVGTDANFADNYWEMACCWHNKAKSVVDVDRCREARADSLVSRGERGLDSYGSSYAAYWVGKGVSVLRQAKADGEKIKKTHLRFLELQKRSRDEMSPREFDPEQMPCLLDSYIEPARRVLASEHSFRLQDLAFLIQANPFVPAGHEHLYLRGIQAGFYGDWIVVAHILIPQLEQSIRHVFQQHQIVTSTLESDGTQKEYDLGWLLTRPEMEEIFGERITFSLRGNLIERFGHNLRNEMSHGLAPSGAFSTAPVLYIWWLTLQMLWFGYKSVEVEVDEPKKNGD